MTQQEAIKNLDTMWKMLTKAYNEIPDSFVVAFTKAIDAVKAETEPNYDEWCTDCKEYDKERHCCPRWNRVIRETLKDAQPEQQWIPCSERLPEKIEKDYWVCTDEHHHCWQCVCKWRKYPSKRGDFWAWHLNARVVAWMPLPEPYRGEQDETD